MISHPAMLALRHCVAYAGAALLLMSSGRAMAGDSERQAAQQALRTLFESEQYGPALDAAALLMDYTSDQYGEKAPELIGPAIQLGDIHRALKQYPRALEAYDRAALLIEINEGIFSNRLVDLLRRISATYVDWERSEDAVAALQRAKVITHRNFGIMNLEQIPLIEDLTVIYAKQHDVISANREQRFALRVSERRFGEDSPDLVPALFRLAEWYRRIRQWNLARDLYRRAATILENSYGDQDVRLVQALTGIADTLRGERALRDEGREALQRAVHVYEVAENPDAADYGASLIALGDWYLLTNDTEEAMDAYERAWELLVAAGGGSTEAAEKQLGKPTRLRYSPAIPEFERVFDETNVDPYVVVEFDVTEKGAIEDAVVVESSAPNRVAREVRLAFLQAKYRPAFEDGKAVTRHVRVRQSYPDSRRPPERPPEEGKAGAGEPADATPEAGAAEAAAANPGAPASESGAPEDGAPPDGAGGEPVVPEGLDFPDLAEPEPTAPPSEATTEPEPETP
jgi:TonB family protein